MIWIKLTGASPDVKDINRAAKLTENGVFMKDLAPVMKRSGVPQARYMTNASIEDLEKAVSGNKPVLAQLKLKRGQHIVVVDGFAALG